jgi:hypothetical protein
MTTGTSLANGGKSESRREMDFYPTPGEVTIALLDFLALPSCVIWEPACGDGAMSRVMQQRGHQVISTDLRHTGFGIGGIDFLNAQHRNCDAVITNPPFNVADQFIRKALSLAPVVAMVLKSQYWHAQKRFDLFDQLPPAWVLPLTWRPDFLNGARGGAPTMDCIWTVWRVGDTDTKYKPLRKPAAIKQASLALGAA